MSEELNDETVDKALSPQSSLEEVFAELMPPSGMRVVPVSLPAPEGKTNIFIALTGRSEECNVMMANLMTYVQEMSAVAEQKAADEAILGKDGKPIEDEPRIVVP